MSFRLAIAGMTVAGLVLGVVLGKTIGTVPRYFGDDPPAPAPRQEEAVQATGIYAFDDELPNHYPMVTPAGRIEVVELSFYVRHRSYWRSMKQYEDWYDVPAYDPGLERDLAEVQAMLEADFDRQVAYDSPSGRHAIAALPADIRGIIQAAQDASSTLPALTPAAEALIVSPIHR